MAGKSSYLGLLVLQNISGFFVRDGVLFSSFPHFDQTGESVWGLLGRNY